MYLTNMLKFSSNLYMYLHRKLLFSMMSYIADVPPFQHAELSDQQSCRVILDPGLALLSNILS